MIWKIAKKEILLNLMTFKFAVGTLVCVVLIAVFMPVLLSDYHRRLGEYNKKVAANEEELRKVKVYKNFTPTIFRRPEILSVFSEGLEKQLGDSVKIQLENVPDISAASTETNPFLSIFPTFDVSLILKIVMSILALLVAYDVISGERERGTLRLTMSSAVARYHVLVGKLLAGLITLLIPLTVAFTLGLLILLSFPMVDLTASDWVRIGLIYFASLIFLSAMYNFGMLFSCLTKKPAISLMFVLLFWVVFLIVIPNGSFYLASQLRPIGSQEKLDAEVNALREEQKAEIRELTKTFEEGGWERQDSRGRRGRNWYSQGAFGNSYIFMYNAIYIEAHGKYCALTEPIRIRHADEIWEMQKRYGNNNLIRQKHLADSIARSSPTVLYENLMSVLSGTDLGRFEEFSKRVKEYRNEVMEYIRSKTDNFSSPSYFTTCRDGDWEEYVKIGEPFDEARKAQNRAEMAKAQEVIEEWIEKKRQQARSLGLDDFPHFVYSAGNLLNSVKRVIPDLALLVFINLLLFALSFVAFLRYDVR